MSLMHIMHETTILKIDDIIDLSSKISPSAGTEKQYRKQSITSVIYLLSLLMSSRYLRFSFAVLETRQNVCFVKG